MSKTRKRQSVAAQRLKQDFPDIHADLVAGRIPTLKKALMKAGLRTKSTPVEKLLKAWGKANAQERAQFLDKIGASRPVTDPTVATGPTAAPLIANGRYLLPQTIRRIESIMASRKISPAQVMTEVGFPSEGRPFTRALARNTSLRLAVIAALDIWLRQQPD
jgi:exo-beta-1,3-glucanase (GH17 family)